jgi:hypothetical protein
VVRIESTLTRPMYPSDGPFISRRYAVMESVCALRAVVSICAVAADDTPIDRAIKENNFLHIV